MSAKTSSREIGLSDLLPLKQALQECEGETFIYRGMEVDRRYAKYLIEWLESIQAAAGGG